MEYYYSIQIKITETDKDGKSIGNFATDGFNLVTDKPMQLRNYLQKLAEAEPDDVEILEFY